MITVYLFLGPRLSVEKPKIIAKSKYFLDGDTFSLNCSVPYVSNHAVELIWETPRKYRKVVSIY